MESAVKDIQDQYNPEWILIEVMDAKTGEILASGSNPSYDPNSIPKDMSYQNPLVSYVFEPGSTMKIYTYMCDSGFERSSNVAIANIISKYLSKDELSACFTKYGFGDVTNIELPNELPGSLNFKYDIEILAAGYGQGILTTPVQHLQALSIIANDGYMVKPHIISKIVHADGNEEVTKIEKSEKIVSTETINRIKQLMRNVIIGENGTGNRYNIEGYDIIGKTGTAQIFENGTYVNNGYILSVALMYPSDNPEIIIYAAVKRPPENSTIILSDAVNGLMQNIAKYRDMFDSNKISSDIQIVTLNNYVNKNTSDVKIELEKKNLKTIVIGDGDKIINQYPEKKTKILTHDYVFLLTNGQNVVMPNLIGTSKSNVLAFCNLINRQCEINGSGYVISQNIEEGSELTDNIVFELTDR